MHLRWNPQCFLRKTTFDGLGRPKDRVWEARWEVWCEDSEGQPYKITVVQGPERNGEPGEYREPDQRLVDMLNLCNPERWGGDIRKMVHALVDEPNAVLRAAEERDWNQWSDDIGKEVAQYAQTKVTVPAQIS